jgi:hypothetical protein
VGDFRADAVAGEDCDLEVHKDSGLSVVRCQLSVEGSRISSFWLLASGF